MPKAKPKATWWVLTEKDGLLRKLYSGPDKRRAREIAAKELGELADDPKDAPKVMVAKISSLTILADSDLKRVLPKDAF